MSYDFQTQLAAGEQAELVLDRHFAQQGITSAPVGMAGQRRGIDRMWTMPGGVQAWVQYKSDWTASRTGNAFIETVSVDRPGCEPVPGWLATSQASVLVYFLPDDELLYVLSFAAVRQRARRWGVYPTRRIPNRDYHTVGVLVPLTEFERLCETVTGCRVDCLS